MLAKLRAAEIERLVVFFPENDPAGPVLHETLRKDSVNTPEEALLEIYRKLRPGDPPTLDQATKLFNAMFFDPQRYDFSRVGRLKFNTKLGLSRPLEEKILHPDDFYAVIRYFMRLAGGEGQLDDIDHLGSRRVRSVGELLENQFRIGLIRMERAIKEKMSVYQEMTTAMPHDLINAKPVDGRGPGVLRVLAAVAVHGPDEPAVGGDAQAPPVGARPRRPLAGARRLRGARRPPVALRPDLPDRDAGRPEHRPDLLARLLRADQRLRLHRVALPPRGGRPGRGPRPLTYAGDSGREVGDILPVDQFEALRREVESRGARVPLAEPYSFYLTAWEEDRLTIAQANAQFGPDGTFKHERVTARSGGEFMLRPARGDRLHRRLAQAARLGRGRR